MNKKQLKRLLSLADTYADAYVGEQEYNGPAPDSERDALVKYVRHLIASDRKKRAVAQT